MNKSQLIGGEYLHVYKEVHQLIISDTFEYVQEYTVYISLNNDTPWLLGLNVVPILNSIQAMYNNSFRC